MKRINVIYDGEMYSIGDRELDAVKAEVEAAQSSVTPVWLSVNSGEGVLQQTELLIVPGVGIALTPIDPHDPSVLDGS